MIEIVLSNLLFPAVASILTWILSRKKYRTEVDGSELDNVEKAIKIWKDLALDLTEELKRTKAELNEVRRELEQLIKRLHGEK